MTPFLYGAGELESWRLGAKVVAADGSRTAGKEGCLHSQKVIITRHETCHASENVYLDSIARRPYFQPYVDLIGRTPWRSLNSCCAQSCQAKRSHKPFPHHMANEATFSPRFHPTADNLQAWVF